MSTHQDIEFGAQPQGSVATAESEETRSRLVSARATPPDSAVAPKPSPDYPIQALADAWLLTQTGAASSVANRIADRILGLLRDGHEWDAKFDILTLLHAIHLAGQLQGIRSLSVNLGIRKEVA